MASLSFSLWLSSDNDMLSQHGGQAFSWPAKYEHASGHTYACYGVHSSKSQQLATSQILTRTEMITVLKKEMQPWKAHTVQLPAMYSSNSMSTLWSGAITSVNWLPSMLCTQDSKWPLTQCLERLIWSWLPFLIHIWMACDSYVEKFGHIPSYPRIQQFM